MKKMIICVAFLSLAFLLASCKTFDDGMSGMKKSFPGKEAPNSTSK